MWNRFSDREPVLVTWDWLLEKRSSSWNREPALGTGNQFLKLEPVLVTENNSPELEFLKSLWGLGTEEEYDYRTSPPGYIGWRNSFLGIDSWDP
jgi:hypothetical protein